MCSLDEAGGADGQGWVERPSERIAHCAEHTREWVRAAGLEMRSVRGSRGGTSARAQPSDRRREKGCRHVENPFHEKLNVLFFAGASSYIVAPY